MLRDKTVEEMRDALQQRMRELAWQLGRIDPDDPRFQPLVKEMFRLGELAKQFDADR
jgi:hypothetical protein